MIAIKKVGLVSLLSLLLLSSFSTAANPWTREIEITITPDKEVYGVEEKAFFTIEMNRDGKPVMIRPEQIEATFPDESVTLTQIAEGIYIYTTPELIELGNYTLSVTVRSYEGIKSIEKLERIKQRFEEKIEWLKKLKEKVKKEREKQCIDRIIAIYQRIIQRIESSIERIRERSIIGSNSCTITVKIKYTQEMEKALEAGNWADIYTYAETLRQEGSRATPELIEAFKDKEKEPIFRKMILEIIEEIKDKDTVEPLIEVLEDTAEDSHIRAEAAFTLGEIGDEEALNSLIEATENSDETIRESAASGLGLLGGEEVIPILLNLLSDESDGVRMSAGAALAHHKVAEALTKFTDLLKNDSNETLRGRAAIWIGSLEISNGVPALIEALNDKSEYVVNNAAIGLGMIKDLSAVDALIQILDKKGLIRIYAADSLAKIGDLRAKQSIASAIEEEEDTWGKKKLKQAYKELTGEEYQG